MRIKKSITLGKNNVLVPNHSSKLDKMKKVVELSRNEEIEIKSASREFSRSN